MSTNSLSTHLPEASPPRKNINKKSILFRMWQARISYFMLLPFLIPFIVFTVLPLGQSAVVSFYDYSAVKTDTAEYVGTDNYMELLSLELRELPSLVDETTGQPVYQCGRKKLPQTEVAAWEAEEGQTCETAFVRARDVLTEGFSDWKTFSVFGTQYVLGARDTRFWTSIINTSIFVAYTVIGKLILGLMVALILRRQSTMNYILRMIFFLPSVTASIAVTVVWGWIFRGQPYGLINYLVLQMGWVSEPISFLNDANWTMIILIVMTIWGGIGYNMILFLAGLQNINPELYEVSAIDGAGPWQNFIGITLPLLRPTLLYVLITSIIGGFQVFEAVYILFASSEGMGGVLDSGLTVVPYLYDSGFRLFQMGYASAIAWILFAIIFVLTLINLRVGRVNEAY
ncbi:MAG: sugar ABC transporter permease [Anaerolineae bacterium]|nr:sugar ABC transporter permease [Anaerolineae bacterium]